MSDDEPGQPGEPFVLPIEDSIDLHAFAPKDIPSVGFGATVVRLRRPE